MLATNVTPDDFEPPPCPSTAPREDAELTRPLPYSVGPGITSPELPAQAETAADRSVEGHDKS